ncbi:DNA-binding FadR family transcriptional regulator [Streptosporangium becharense]|uniref:DNA-binding FadR family transcriptional regulator n=1 Tax=Streptosporangium becharense TaxID=1816182 RepID=A0A7W9IMY9_9ACTN|nr:FCD domain-containing protein [Streptosporangium becharense]MBB2910345.1 DNA-binding FadR family transcriptional regulator [Streptosporangium becharense]MBB5823088.1 DNA-binding FadR family transcriptional regulator [Streptosporangium becharense]
MAVSPTGAGLESLLPERWPKRPRRLASVVVSTLVDRIVAGHFPPGTPLPPEPVLCETFDVSRTTIREAVKVLEEKGLVRARQGSGTSVTDEDDWNLLDPMVLSATVRHDDELRTLDQLVDVRQALESQMAAQAALAATDADLREIEAVLERLTAQTRTPELFVETDVAFHERVMTASGNRLGRAVVRTVHAEARTSLRYTGHPRPEDCELSNAGHAEVYRCLLARDPDGAASAMSTHILEAWRRRRPAPRSS